ncbi:hypothetical protein BVRB_1g018700 [Beta vulgaris subsp. vulgaris]|nr:hypothetical protein BVRB_1g018700 [Beta vulgaris subsp. vulgaris]
MEYPITCLLLDFSFPSQSYISDISWKNCMRSLTRDIQLHQRTSLRDVCPLF